MLAKLLDWAYRGELLCSRLQGIAFDRPAVNGEYRLIRILRSVTRFAVDAGSYHGDWAWQVLQHAAADVRVACIEADPRNAEHIRRRAAAEPRIQVHHGALSDRIGALRFAAGAAENCGSGYVDRSDAAIGIEVPGLTLDALSRQYQNVAMDLVKCDIEGEEMAALRGAQRLFQEQRIGAMQVEYNVTWLRNGHRLKELFDFAARYQYSVLIATPLGFMHMPTYGEGLEDYRMRNLVLTRGDLLSLLKPFGPSGRARIEHVRSVQPIA